MFLFTHDLFCKQLSYEIQEIRDFFRIALIHHSWAVASGYFKVSAKPERKDIPWATKSLG